MYTCFRCRALIGWPPELAAACDAAALGSAACARAGAEADSADFTGEAAEAVAGGAEGAAAGCGAGVQMRTMAAAAQGGSAGGKGRLLRIGLELT
mmetsp:Transcript_37267/g.93550  ORF Transcript_37267/g.93550 Transcript_37267/m.93550 type:complete len:95 (+) Transcript_37267:1445-1729(+)